MFLGKNNNLYNNSILLIFVLYLFIYLYFILYALKYIPYYTVIKIAHFAYCSVVCFSQLAIHQSWLCLHFWSLSFQRGEACSGVTSALLAGWQFNNRKDIF